MPPTRRVMKVTEAKPYIKYVACLAYNEMTKGGMMKASQQIALGGGVPITHADQPNTVARKEKSRAEHNHTSQTISCRALASP
jgi:hypothetical protein